MWYPKNHYKNRIGEIKNNRKILKFDHTDNLGHIFWEVQCLICKYTYAIRYDNFLNYGDSNHCRCTANAKLNGNAFERLSKRLFQSYKHHAKIRSFAFKLTLEEVRKLLLSNCYYCGSQPSTEFKDYLVKHRKSILYTGIDRLDNKKGYFSSNVVPCCKICNSMKSNRNFDDFIQQVHKIVQNQKDKLK